MKKRNNKVIVLVVAGIIFAVLLVVFILNYSKDDYSFSILEKKWINDNTRNVLDVNVYNDVPIYGKQGKGVAFDLLDKFTEKYNVNFNKISYSVDSPPEYKEIAFKIVNNNTSLTDNDILLYEDSYVLVSKEKSVIDKITDMKDLKVLVLNEDIGLVSNYLSEANNVSFEPKDSIDDIETALSEDDSYALIPYNMYIDVILSNDLNILYHLSDISKKYVLTVQNKTLSSIMKKYYLQYSEKLQKEAYKSNFLDEFFYDKKISEADRLGYNSSSYNVGYISYMPFEGREEKDFVGTLSNYLSDFEDLFDVDFKLISYNNIADLKKDLSSGELDLVFANYNLNGINVDIINTNSLFKEEYVILSKDTFIVNSVKSLKDREVSVVKDSYIYDFVNSNGVRTKTFDNNEELCRSLSSNSVVIVDKDTYNYYKNKKFSDYNVLYEGVLPYEYTFAIRDVNKNTVFAKLFSYYTSSVNYEGVRYAYNTNSTVYDFGVLVTFITVVATILFIVLTIFIVKKKKNKEVSLRNYDKLKYIDSMTSLKNRTYLNSKIKEWDDNVIYPQAFVVVDLNNLKYINDSHGHEEGDTLIKKAASILIVNQEANTDIIRTDGNEFLIYMVGYDEKKVVAYIRKIYKELKELPYGFGAAIGYSMILDDVKQ